MNKKIQLICLSILSTLYLGAQTSQKPSGTCATTIPSQQWEAWFQSAIEKYEEERKSSKQIVLHTIPVIVHIVHFGETVGTYPNIDSNEVKTQIAVLNADFAGNGLNSQKAPAVFANLKVNTGIRFCLAKTDLQDLPLAERGIHRVNANSNSWLSPNTPSLDVYDYFRTVIMPGSIWDPTKYMNIWISDKPADFKPNGFATYPSGTPLTGLYNGPLGTQQTDGVWIYTATFGTVGVTTAPYNKGRTCTHEVGHWLGLRHMWGDGNCLTDYVGDTPYHKHANYGCPSTPSRPDTCGVNTAPNGEMPMNFMDRTNDTCMYMFTQQQNVRMQTAMSQAPYRFQLGSHNKCDIPSGVPAAAFANFNLTSPQCVSGPFVPFNTSTGSPPPTYIWQVTPGAQIVPNQTVPNPAITFPSPGQYTITLSANNASGASTKSMVVVATGTCQTHSLCLDTIRMIKKVDTLVTYKAPAGNQSACLTGARGYMAGTNCYQDKEVAQFFPPTSYTSTPQPQVNSVIVLFDSAGTNAVNPSTQIACKIYGGTATGGPVGLIGQKSDRIDSIINTPVVATVGYCGKSGQVPINNTKILPYKFDFASPIVINSTSGFYISLQNPVNSPLDSINIYSNTKYNNVADSTSWFLPVTNSWRTFKGFRGTSLRLAIMPQITCSPAVGIKENLASLSSNVMVMPNPNSGLFNVIFTLKKQQQINIRIYSSLGHEILNNDLKNVMNNMISMDLTGYSDGIYFAEISNGEEKVVRKIVVTH